MSPAEYLDSVKERLLTDPLIIEFHIRSRFYPADGDAHVKRHLSAC